MRWEQCEWADRHPYGDSGADEMVDSIMHELSETVTDPDLNAWYTSNGSENGDLCNYNYAARNITPHGAVTIGSSSGSGRTPPTQGVPRSNLPHWVDQRIPRSDQGRIKWRRKYW